MLKEVQDKKNVRGYEEAKAKGTFKLTDDAQDGGSKLATNYFLDDLWARIRNFLNDLNEKGEKRTFGRVDKANKLKLLEAFESLDITKRGLLSDAQME